MTRFPRRIRSQCSIALPMVVLVLTLTVDASAADAQARAASTHRDSASRSRSDSAETGASASPGDFVLLLHTLYVPALSGSETQRLVTPYDTPAPLEAHGAFDARYKFNSGFGMALAGRVRLYRRLGFWLEYAMVERSGAANLTLRLPHPFYSQPARESRGSSDQYGFTVSVLHSDAALLFEIGPLDGTLLAGASFFTVEADLVDDVRYSYAYPYASENLSITELPRSAVSDTPIGFNVGCALDYRLGRHLAAGILLRYAGAKGIFVREANSPVEIDLAGLRASGGISLYF